MSLLNSLERALAIVGSLASILSICFAIYFKVKKKNQNVAIFLVGFSIVSLIIVFLLYHRSVESTAESRSNPESVLQEPEIVLKAANIPKERSHDIYKSMEGVILEAEKRGIKLDFSFQTRTPASESEIVLLVPNQSIRTLNPTFLWSLPTDSMYVKLAITDVHGQELWQLETFSNSVEFGSDQVKLTKGTTYFWSITSLFKGAPISEQNHFYILSKEEERQLKNHLQNIDELRLQRQLGQFNDNAEILVMLHFNLFDEARVLLEDIVMKDPVAKNPKRLLSYVYKQLGWNWRLTHGTNN